MTNTENGKKYSIIAAICFAVLAVYYVISDIVYYSGNEYSSLSFLDILGWAIAIGFAVTLFLKNKFAVTIVSGIYALLHVYAQGKKDFVSKLQIALKECYETEYWIELFVKADVLDRDVAKDLYNQCGTIRRLLIASINTAKDNMK